jgi:hypothetical protein
VAKIYCHQCTLDLGIVRAASPESLTGTQYQLGKFLKHTAPTGTYPVNSVFDNPAYEAYQSYVVSAASSGSALVRDDGRVNLLWLAGRQIGVRLEGGQVIAPADLVVLVLVDDQYHMHAYPEISSGLGVYDCDNCGRNVISSGTWSAF